MSRLDVLLDKKMNREREGTLLAVYGALEAGVERGGGELLRASFVFNEGDCLCVLKARFPGGVMIGFVGAEDFAQALRKATTEAARDGVRWKEDKWRANGG